jgi:uncharacterized protein (DUF2147 family)
MIIFTNRILIPARAKGKHRVFLFTGCFSIFGNIYSLNSYAMKKLVSISLFLLMSLSLMAQSSQDVVGFWLTGDGDSQVEIYQKSNGKYYGKIVWLEEPHEEDGSVKRDDENPDEDLRDRKIMGLQILKEFEYDTDDNRWEDGRIYDPKSGKTYDCYMWFEDGDKDVLHVKGYIGISIIGRETEWTRENSKRQ